MYVSEAHPGDAREIASVARESWHAAYDGILGAETVEETVEEWYALEGITGDISDATSRDDTTFLVCERSKAADTVDTARSGSAGDGATKPDSNVVGFAHAGPHPDLEGTAKLSRIYARPRVWGDGVGSRLLQRLEHDLRDHFETLWLEVLADNDVGISFYEGAGFERIDEQESVLGESRVREYLYEKPL